MKSLLNTVSLSFGIIMILVITSWATALLFTSFMSDMLYGTKRIVFIFLLFGYAAYRGFRIYQITRQVRHEQKQDR